MSVKRQADSELNHENWNDEDPEDDKDMGQFKAASKEILEKRVIRTAKRRNPISSEDKKSVFSGFGGFNKAQPTSFDFLANLTNGNKNNNGSTNKSQTSSTPGLFTNKPAAPSSSLFGAQTSASVSSPPSHPIMMASPFGKSIKTSQSTLFTTKNVTTTKETPFKLQPVSSTTQIEPKFGISSTGANDNNQLFTSTPVKPQISSTNTAMVQTSFGISTTPTITSVTPEKKSDGNEKSNEKKIKYFSKLKGLNEAVSDWISKHVAQTPLCILSPIFKDYEKYLKEITEEYHSADKEASDNMDVENTATKIENTRNTNISFANNSPSPFTSNSSSGNAKTPVHFGISNSNSSLSKNGTSNQDTKTTPFGATNPGSSPLTSQNTKLSSPFAINNSVSPSNIEDTKNPTPFAINNTNSSPLTSPKSSTAFTMNNIGSSPLNSQETKTPFGIPNNNNASPFTRPSSATPKPLFGAQNNLASSPENKSTFSFGINTSSTNASTSPTPSTGFSIGVTPSASSTTSPFSLSTNASTNQTSTAPFSFGIGKPFSFSPNTLAQKPSSETTNENEEDEPPKVEYTPVKEDNSIYEKKCKIFVKKDGNFVDKGVGTLYIKKIEGNIKHQLLVRANTNLGTVLLNLVLGKAIPTQRMGKNNVMLVCIPTPDAKPPPTPILIRVKTGEEADEVLETLNKYKA